MSNFTLNSSSRVFTGILKSLDKYGYNCQFRNLSSIALKSYNLLIVENSQDSKLFDLNRAQTSQPPTTTTSTATPSIDEDGLRSDYDYDGALVYIIFILCFYSLSIILMVVIQTRKSELYRLDEGSGFDEASARNVFKRIRTENVEREALEDLRDAAWREKLWSIYTTNPNNYKIRRYESKRVQQIDRKLRQYYSVESTNNSAKDKDNHYRTFDPSQLDNRSSFRERLGTHGPLLLLKDLNKLEYHHSNSVPDAPFAAGEAAAAPSPAPPSSRPISAQGTHLGGLGPRRASYSNFKRPKMPTAVDNSNAEATSGGPRRLSNRFVVEKIKDDVV